MLINKVTECTNFMFNVFLNKSKAITNNISFTSSTGSAEVGYHGLDP